MAEASLAKTSFVMEADATQMQSGLTQAAASIQAFMQKTKSVMSGVSSSLGLGTLFAPITSLVSGAIMGGITSLKDNFKELAAAVSEANKDAGRWGASTDDVMALGFAAKKGGLEYEEFAKIMTKFRQHVGGDMTAELFKFSDQLAATQDPMVKAQMAAERFGKGGVRALSFLGEGADELKKKMELGKSLGIVLDPTQIASITQANSALKGMSDVIGGVMNQLTVAFAPLIVWVGEKFQQWAPYISAFGRAAGQAFDYWFKVIGGLVSIIWNQVENFFASFTNSSGAVVDWGEVWALTCATAKAGLYVIAVALGYVWDTIKAIGGIVYMVFGQIGMWAGQAAKALGFTWGNALERVSEKARRAGYDMVMAFGNTHTQIDALFDNLDKKADMVKKNASDTRAMIDYHKSGAFEKGGKDAISVEAKWQTEMMAQDKGQADLARQNLNVLKKIEENTKPKPPNPNRKFFDVVDAN